MTRESTDSFTIFQGHRRLLQADRHGVLQFLRQHAQAVDSTGQAPLWTFDDRNGMRLDLDWRSELAGDAQAGAADGSQAHAGAGAQADAQAGAPADLPTARGVGRPKLGVVAREVTLLPRHWEWLGSQPGGASASLRRLVEQARTAHARQDAVRAAAEASYRFMTEIAGDLPGFEEASRALFARQADSFARHTQAWPDDVRSYLQQLSEPLWNPQD